MKKITVALILTLALCVVPYINGSNTAAASDEIPSWVTKTKVKGDLRFRFQTEDRASELDDSEQIDRNRWRIRWRLGIESKPNDQWKVGFGLASGSDDPRSTNQTLQNFFDTPGAQLDYAYAKWSPMDSIDLMVGKFKNPIWGTKDLIWDSDLRPEGMAAQINLAASDYIDVFFTPVFLIVDEYADEDNADEPEDDPQMYGLQAGTKMGFGEAVSTKFAVSYYKINNTAEIDFFMGEEDYSALVLDAEAGFTALPVYVGVFGQYVSSDADDYDTGYLVGFKCGDKKVKKLGDWQIKYNYRKLEAYGWWNALPDSDFMGGDTNVKGHEIEATVGLAKNVTFGIDYYMSELDDPDFAGFGGYDPNEEEFNLLQVDLVVKF